MIGPFLVFVLQAHLALACASSNTISRIKIHAVVEPLTLDTPHLPKDPSPRLPSSVRAHFAQKELESARRIIEKGVEGEELRQAVLRWKSALPTTPAYTKDGANLRIELALLRADNKVSDEVLTKSEATSLLLDINQCRASHGIEFVAVVGALLADFCIDWELSDSTCFAAGVILKENLRHFASTSAPYTIMVFHLAVLRATDKIGENEVTTASLLRKLTSLLTKTIEDKELRLALVGVKQMLEAKFGYSFE